MALTVLMFLPLLVILWLANLAERRRAQGKPDHWPAGIGLGLLASLLVLLILVGALVFSVGALSQLVTWVARSSGQGVEALAAAGTASGIWMGLSLLVPSLVGLGLLLAPVRRLIGRVLSIDPASTVHAVALAFSMLILINLFVMLATGLDTLAAAIEADPTRAMEAASPAALWVQELLMAAMALVGVGWFSRRRLGQVLQRLGLVRPSLRQVGAGLAIGCAMAVLVWGADRALGAVGITVDSDVQKLSELLLGSLGNSILGVITLGVAAAVGEEPLFRGALQPRFGLLPTAVLFTLLHGQYGVSLATGFTFAGGIVLGLVRQRANTSTAMIVHAVYNMASVLIGG